MENFELYKSFNFKYYRAANGKHTDNSAGAPYHYIGYLHQGTARLHSTKGTIELEAGDLFYIPKGCSYHSYWYDGATFDSFAFSAIPFEAVSVKSFDGLALFGRYYPAREPNAPLQIQFHGYRGTAMRDFSGGNKLARESGHATLVVDQRAHGKSEGRTIGFGVLERRDLLSWVGYAVSRFGADTPIFLSGLSMGAATVLMAADLPLPKNIVGIIADCPYSSPRKIISQVCRKDYHLPPTLVYPLIRLSALLFGHFDPDSASALSSVGAAHIPMLVIHGEDDRFVPVEMSRALAAASDRLTLLTFPEAGHGLSYMVDTPRYEKAVTDFVIACLKKQ